jgi:hypothetical protein
VSAKRPSPRCPLSAERRRVALLLAVLALAGRAVASVARQGRHRPLPLPGPRAEEAEALAREGVEGLARRLRSAGLDPHLACPYPHKGAAFFGDPELLRRVRAALGSKAPADGGRREK